MSNPNVKPRWKKGESGNPAGKPKGTRSLTTLLREAMIKVGKGESEPYDEQLIKKVLDMATKQGNEAMIRLCWNYLEGMPKETKEIDFKGEVPPEEKEKLAQAAYDLIDQSAKTGSE